jgi:hypothetical protein
MTYPHNDPYEQAMTDPPQYFGGRIETHAWECILEKGVGKVPYDPVQHKGQRTSIAIDVTIEPFDPTQSFIERSMLNWTPDFKKVVRPSVEALAAKIGEIRGLQLGKFNPLKQITGLYVVGEFVERPDNGPDEDWTTLHIIDVFAEEDEGKAALERLRAGAEQKAKQKAKQSQQERSFLLWCQLYESQFTEKN